jgi:hypothetical protein
VRGVGFVSAVVFLGAGVLLDPAAVVSRSRELADLGLTLGLSASTASMNVGACADIPSMVALDFCGLAVRFPAVDACGLVGVGQIGGYACVSGLEDILGVAGEGVIVGGIVGVEGVDGCVAGVEGSGGLSGISGLGGSAAAVGGSAVDVCACAADGSGHLGNIAGSSAFRGLSTHSVCGSVWGGA